MAKPQVEVKGYPELFSGSKALAKKFEAGSKGEFVKVARKRAVMIAARMPRRSGRMAASVRGTGSRAGLARVGSYKSRVPYLGWIEFGGTRGRTYEPGGRYIYPVGLEAESELSQAATKTAINDIRGFRWKSPS